MAKKNPPSSPRGIVDRRATEKAHAYIQQMTKGQDFGSLEELNQFLSQNLSGKCLDDMELSPATPAEAAQATMYEAFDARSSARRIALAKEALLIFPDCADAYVLLAEETEDIEKALEYFRKGVNAGRQALGDEYIKEHKGTLWSSSGRPYMRAMYGVADCLFQIDQYEEAASICQEMLQLNKSDNQGVRYLLLSALIMLKQFPAAKKILDSYKDDCSAHLKYSKALILHHTSKDQKALDKALLEALASNAYIPALLLTPDLIPDGEMPDSYSPGSLEEALLYVDSNMECWHSDAQSFQGLLILCSTHMIALATNQEKQKESALRDKRGSGRYGAQGGNNVLDLNYFLKDGK
jgi:tetratricopeptide (TPR) repeat protein